MAEVHRFLSKTEKEKLQAKGYMCEHLLCLYSMVSEQTALFDEAFPVFLSDAEADAILFGIGEQDKDPAKCLGELRRLPVDTLNVVSPSFVMGFGSEKKRDVDWDFHVEVDQFDFELKGERHKSNRYNVKRARKAGYRIELSRKLTPRHTYILSRHMARHRLDVWDYEELLSLDRFFREHDHGMMIEAHRGEKLVGFDVVDFLEEKSVMAVPLGVYSELPFLSDFMVYEDLRVAEEKGYRWVDLGLACGNEGLRSFKEKWGAKPKYRVCVQAFDLSKERERMN